MMFVNLGIGLLTPPVGNALFAGCAVGNISIEKAVRSTIPFYATLVAVLLLVAFVPALAMTLPGLLGL